jgi:hypothetical protein
MIVDVDRARLQRNAIFFLRPVALEIVKSTIESQIEAAGTAF